MLLIFQSDQIVTCLPDVVHDIIDPEWDFMILACDGIWDVLSSQEVVDFITERISRGMEPEDICEDLMNRLNFILNLKSTLLNYFPVSDVCPLTVRWADWVVTT